VSWRDKSPGAAILPVSEPHAYLRAMLATHLKTNPLRALLLLGLAAACHTLPAEVMTLTDTQGRSILADVMSLNGDVVKIRRDDGIYFDLKLQLLVEEDRKKLADWAKREADRLAALPLPDNALNISVSRTKLDTKKTNRTIQLVKSTIRGIEYEPATEVSVTESWGYGVTIGNNLSTPISDLRIDYRIYVKQDSRSTKAQEGRLDVGTLETRKREALKTGGVTFNYTYILGRTSAKSPGGQIHGIWLRIYRGDSLVKEYSTPENLMTEHRW